MIRVVHPGSRIRMLTFSHPGSKSQKGTQSRIPDPQHCYRITNEAGSLKMNTALEYRTRVVQEGGRRFKKSTLNDLVHLTPLRIPLMNPPICSKSTFTLFESLNLKKCIRTKAKKESETFFLLGTKKKQRLICFM
jgi:hypothetical protein